jgi:hypothetical protein
VTTSQTCAGLLWAAHLGGPLLLPAGHRSSADTASLKKDTEMTIEGSERASTRPDHGEFTLTWDVSRVLYSEGPLFRWVASVELTGDAAPREPTEPAEGRLIGYFAPIAAYGGSTWLDFESESLDLEIIASAICRDGSTLTPSIHEKYGEENEPGLFVIDLVDFAPRLRGRGLLSLMLGDLVAALPGIGLVACQPGPLGIRGFPDLEGEDYKRAQRRLAKHYRSLGFVRLPRGDGIFLAHPFALTRDWSGEPRLDPAPDRGRLPTRRTAGRGTAEAK